MARLGEGGEVLLASSGQRPGTSYPTQLPPTNTHPARTVNSAEAEKRCSIKS